MANPFEVQVYNPLQSLMAGEQGYSDAQKRGLEQQKLQTQNEAAQLWQSGNKQGALARLLQGGNFDAATAYGNVDQREYSRGRDTTLDARHSKEWEAEMALKRAAAARAADRTPANFVPDSSAPGGYRPIGPADPDYIRRKAEAEAAASNGGVYGTPIYAINPETNKMELGAIGKDGKFKRIDTNGLIPAPGGIKPLDTGTGYVPFDPRRGTVNGPTVQKTGDISKDYAPVVGDDGSISAAPIPGTPAAQTIEEDAAKKAARMAQTVEGGTSVKSIIQDVRTKVTAAPMWNPAVGIGAGVASRVPGSNATDTGELIKTITANIRFDRLQRMREESPTGGALGAVAVQELESLQKTIASLAQNQSKAQFLANLNRVENQYNNILKRAAAYPNAGKYGFGASSAPAAPLPDPLGLR